MFMVFIERAPIVADSWPSFAVLDARKSKVLCSRTQCVKKDGIFHGDKGLGQTGDRPIVQRVWIAAD